MRSFSIMGLKKQRDLLARQAHGTLGAEFNFASETGETINLRASRTRRDRVAGADDLGGEAALAPGGGAFAVGADALADVAGGKFLTAHEATAIFADRRLVWFRFLIVTSGRH